ncbi:MAG TPA: hypothetical protein VH590_15515 [Ktedonobacterales bacterium]|jgi:hypothetical protein
MLAAGTMLLACILLVFIPTGYAFYRYRAAQVFADNISASGQPVTLPTRQADLYTLTLQPQNSAPGGMTLGFTLRDSFGRTLASSTDFYTAGCPSNIPSPGACTSQSRDFPFHNTLGGPVRLTLQSTQANARVSVQVRDESAGGIFASGSLILFGAFFGCGALLWVVSAALIVLFARRLESRRSPQRQGNGKAPEGNSA